MSQRFFAIILILVIVIFVLLKIVIPMWNFMLRADLAISLYDMLKNLLNDNFQCKKQTEIQLGVYTIRYSSTLEAYEILKRKERILRFSQVEWYAGENLQSTVF